MSTTEDSPAPNFTSEYSVILDHPLETVFPILAHGEHLERSVRLSVLCVDFTLTESDTAHTLGGAPLAQSHVLTLPSAVDPGGLPRQFFRLQERIPLAFGLSSKVEIAGALTWDDGAKVALYESVADGPGQVHVWKLREFSEVAGESEGTPRTCVKERIEGRCPGWMKFIVQRETRRSHRDHMNQYYTLFL